MLAFLFVVEVNVVVVVVVVEHVLLRYDTSASTPIY